MVFWVIWGGKQLVFLFRVNKFKSLGVINNKDCENLHAIAMIFFILLEESTCVEDGCLQNDSKYHHEEF